MMKKKKLVKVVKHIRKWMKFSSTMHPIIYNMGRASQVEMLETDTQVMHKIYK